MLSRYNHTGGVYRPPKAYSATEEGHQNAFLMSVLRPWLGAIAPVPDGRLRGAILKTTHSNTTLTSAASNQYMIVAPFASPRRCLRVYAWDTVKSRFYFLQTVEQDEDLSQYFLQLRLVSAGLCLVSSTVTGNSFTVSGNVNGINYYDLPDVFVLTHETLVSYKRNNSGAVAGVPVSDGVTALAVPDADHVFDVPRVPNLTWNAKQVYSQLTAQSTPAAAYAATTEVVIFTSSAAGLGGTGQLVPPNCWGKVKGKAQTIISITAAPAANTQCIVTVYFDYYRADPVTYLEQIVPVQVGSAAFTVTTAAAAVYAVTIPLDNDSEPELGRVRVSVQFGLALSCSVGCNVRLETYDIYRDNIQGPGSVYTIKGTNTGQQLSLDAIYNYEVVPNADLARNVPSAFVGSIASQELEVAHTMLANATQLGIRFILPASEYNAMQANGFYDQISQQENAMAHAASFGSLVAQMARFLKPIARQGLSAAAMAGGNALVPYLGPAAIPLGTAAAGIVNKAFSSDDSSGQFPPGTRAYAADDQEAPGKKSRTEPGTPPKTDLPSTDVGMQEGAPESTEWEGDWSAETLSPPHEEDPEVDQSPEGIASFCATAPILAQAAEARAQASSLPFLPSLAEIVSAAAPAGGVAAPMAPATSHAPIAAFGFDREKSQVTAFAQRLAQNGDAAPIIQYFNKLGVVGHRAKMVATVAGAGEARALPATDLYVTDRPVQRARADEGVPNYRAVAVAGMKDPIFIDDKLENPPKDLSPLAAFNPLLSQLIASTTGKLFVTLARTHGIASIGGASWHMALYAALCLSPYGAIFSGSLDSNATDLIAKVSAAAASRPVTQLIVLNPLSTELPTTADRLHQHKLGMRVENPLGDPGFFPILYATGSLPAALSYAFIGLSSVDTPEAAAEKAKNKAINLEQAQRINPNILLPNQKVMVGGKLVEVDISKLDPKEYVKKEYAKEAIAKVSPGATLDDIVRKWSQMIAAKPPMWGSLAQKWAAVESARMALTNAFKPGTPAPAGAGNPANRKRREKEKQKKLNKLAAQGVPPKLAGSALPSVPDAEMGGGQKRTREENRPEM